MSAPDSTRPQVAEDSTTVLQVADIGADAVQAIAARYGLELVMVAPGTAIPGSYWGDREAGLRGRTLFLRDDTPVHSALHELAHFVCMDESRRASLDRDAGGDYAEEDAVCYLQILLADELHGMDRAGMLRDMDAWGYTFRLGSARAWFELDAADAAAWLERERIVDRAGHPSGQCRGCDGLPDET